MASAEKIRVLIVDDIAETRENIRKMLQFENDMDVVGAARTGREAVDLSRELKPDVVLMDINMPDMDGIAATEAIRRESGMTQIVILSVQGEANYMRRAMLAGARDFLAKPPSVDELTGAIRQAGRMAAEERAKSSGQEPSSGSGGNAGKQRSGTGKLISVYSPRGGAGTTTIATNLAIALHSEETPVVVVDGNLQFGDVAVFLNVQGKNSVIDLAPRVADLDADILDEVMVTHPGSGLKILAAPARPEYAENVTPEEFNHVLRFLAQHFAYVIVDTATDLSDITLSVFDCSDLIVLIATQDIPAIKNARLFLDLVDVLKIDRKKVLFIMNQFDKRIGILPQKVGESFHHEVSVVLPADEQVVIPSVNRGIPFMLGDRSKPIAKGIQALADASIQRLEEGSRAEAELVPALGHAFSRR